MKSWHCFCTRTVEHAMHWNGIALAGVRRTADNNHVKCEWVFVTVRATLSTPLAPFHIYYTIYKHKQLSNARVQHIKWPRLHYYTYICIISNMCCVHALARVYDEYGNNMEMTQNITYRERFVWTRIVYLQCNEQLTPSFHLSFPSCCCCCC